MTNPYTPAVNSSNGNKTGRIGIVGALLIGVCLLRPAVAEELSPTGVWKTFDDKTGKARGLVRIWEQQGKWFGKIESSIDPQEAKEHCDKCTDDRKNKPVLGLLILRNMQRRGPEYSGGDILDPDTGWIYRCKFRLTDDGKTLELRGYLGVALLGRTQIWKREK